MNHVMIHTAVQLTDGVHATTIVELIDHWGLVRDSDMMRGFGPDCLGTLCVRRCVLAVRNVREPKKEKDRCKKKRNYRYLRSTT